MIIDINLICRNNEEKIQQTLESVSEQTFEAFRVLIIDDGSTDATPDIVGEVINIGPDEEFITINNLAARLIKMVEFKGKPIFMPGRPQEVKMATCSADKTRKLLGYKTKTKLDDGLNTMVDWIRQTGARKFRYHLEIEIHTESLPDTWGKKLM